MKLLCNGKNSRVEENIRRIILELESILWQNIKIFEQIIVLFYYVKDRFLRCPLQ